MFYLFSFLCLSYQVNQGWASPRWSTVSSSQTCTLRGTFQMLQVSGNSKKIPMCICLYFNFNGRLTCQEPRPRQVGWGWGWEIDLVYMSQWNLCPNGLAAALLNCTYFCLVWWISFHVWTMTSSMLTYFLSLPVLQCSPGCINDGLSILVSCGILSQFAGLDCKRNWNFGVGHRSLFTHSGRVLKASKLLNFFHRKIG